MHHAYITLEATVLQGGMPISPPLIWNSSLMRSPNGPHLTVGLAVFSQLLCGRHGPQWWHLSLTSPGIHTNSGFPRPAACQSGDIC